MVDDAEKMDERQLNSIKLLMILIYLVRIMSMHKMYRVISIARRSETIMNYI